jgi:hypothetical protein
MKDLYTAIEAHITTFLPEIKHVDLFNNQLAELQVDENNGLPFDLPAIFVEFAPIQWAKQSSKQKNGTVEVRIHILQENYSQSFRNSQDKEDALDVLDLVDKVDDTFENFKAENHTPFDGVSTEPDNDHGTVINYIHQYKCSTTKKINKPGTSTTNVTITDINVDGELKRTS